VAPVWTSRMEVASAYEDKESSASSNWNRLQQLEQENERLKRLLADRDIEIDILRSN
jgi:hypothetical protein